MSSHCTVWVFRAVTGQGVKRKKSKSCWLHAITHFKASLFFHREILSPRCWSHSTFTEVGCWGNQQSPSERNQNPHHAGWATRGPQETPRSYRHVSAVSEWSLWSSEKSCRNCHPCHQMETFLKMWCFIEIYCPLLLSCCKSCMIIFDLQKQNSFSVTQKQFHLKSHLSTVSHLSYRSQAERWGKRKGSKSRTLYQELFPEIPSFFCHTRNWSFV